MSDAGLPLGWEQVTLGDILPLSYGKALPKTRRDPNGSVLVFGSSGVIGRHSMALVAEPALMVGRKGSVGEVYLSPGPSWPIDTVYFTVPKPGLDLKFFHYLLDHLRLGTLDRSTAVPGLSRDDYSRVTVAIPPSPEQHRIVAAVEEHLSRLDAAVTALEHVRATLPRYRGAVLKAACEGRLVDGPSDNGGTDSQAHESIPAATTSLSARRKGRLWGSGVVPELTAQERDGLPNGWVWSKVKNLGDNPDEVVQVGPMSMRSREFAETGVPVMNVGTVQWGYFAEDKCNFLPRDKTSAFSRYRLRPGDVLFTRSGTVGRSAVAKSKHDGWLITFHLLRVRVDPLRCLPEFLRVVFEGADHIRRQRRSASIGTTRAGFNTNLLANLDVPLPPIGEQRDILAEVDRRLSLADAADRAVSAGLAKAKRLRQAILKRAFEGKLVPQDPSDEPASVLLERIRAAKGSASAPKATRGRRTRLAGK